MQARKLKLIAKFLTHLLEKQLFDVTVKYEKWVQFCIEFDNFKCAKDLHKLLIESGNQKEEEGNRNNTKSNTTNNYKK